MERVLRAAILAALFGLTAWAGYALARPAPVPPGTSPPRGAPPDPDDPAAAAPPGELRGDLDGGGAPAVPRRTPPAAPARPAPAPEGPERIAFNDLTQWDLDPNDVRVPASIRALEGKELDIVGYMLPYGNPEAVEQFMLVKDMGSCCFGSAPLPHHLIECTFEEGKKTVYAPGPVRVRGRFRVEEHRQGRFLISVFAMTVSDCSEVR